MLFSRRCLNDGYFNAQRHVGNKLGATKRRCLKRESYPSRELPPTGQADRYLGSQRRRDGNGADHAVLLRWKVYMVHVARKTPGPHLNGEYSAGTKNSDKTPFSFTVSEPPAVSSEAFFAASQSGSALNPLKLSLAASWLLWARR